MKVLGNWDCNALVQSLDDLCASLPPCCFWHTSLWLQNVIYFLILFFTYITSLLSLSFCVYLFLLFTLLASSILFLWKYFSHVFFLFFFQVLLGAWILQTCMKADVQFNAPDTVIGFFLMLFVSLFLFNKNFFKKIFF